MELIDVKESILVEQGFHCTNCDNLADFEIVVGQYSTGVCRECLKSFQELLAKKI